MHPRRPFAAVSLAVVAFACSAIAAGASTLASYDFPPAAGPWSLAPGEYYADVSGASFQTSSGFDAGGHVAGLGGSTQERSFRTYVDLGWKPLWSLQLAIPFTSTMLRPDGGAALSETGLGDLSVGLRLKLANGPNAAAVQLRWETPGGYDKTLPAPLGDGLQKLSLTAQFGGPLGKAAFWQLGGGYRMQYKSLTDIGDEVSKNPEQWKWPDHVVTNGALAAWFGRVQAAGLFATDVRSFQTGTDTPRATSFVLGTRFTYRMDARLDVFAGSWHTASGRNSLALNEYYTGIAWKTTKLGRLQGFTGGDARP